MTSEKYLDQFRKGTLPEKLRKMADEYLGPGGQSSNVQEANRLKRENLLEAASVVENAFSEVERKLMDGLSRLRA